jgi:hypothetical protein
MDTLRSKSIVKKTGNDLQLKTGAKFNELCRPLRLEGALGARRSQSFVEIRTKSWATWEARNSGCSGNFDGGRSRKVLCGLLAKIFQDSLQISQSSPTREKPDKTTAIIFHGLQLMRPLDDDCQEIFHLSQSGAAGHGSIGCALNDNARDNV